MIRTKVSRPALGGALLLFVVLQSGAEALAQEALAQEALAQEALAQEAGDCPIFRRGDATADGQNDLSDAVYILAWRFTGGPEPSCQKAADVNDDSKVDITDAIGLLLWLFQGGAIPPAPGPDECGRDPTPDDLTCIKYEPCEHLCGGCSSNVDCPRDEFCDKELGDCEGRGDCVPRPEGCPEIFDPVCGCDGATYGNHCEANANGVSVLHAGECELTPCGRIIGARCDEGEYCEFELGTCNVADNAGVCVPVPEVCPAILDPVCGCDGNTYGNDCERRSAKVQKLHDGPCQDICNGFAGIECDEGEFCELEDGTCHIIADASGVCVEIPDACPDVFDPVCGCDGKTYSNDCDRRAAGVSKVHDGECRDEPRCGGIPGIRCPAGEHCELPEGQCDIADGQGVCVPAPRGCPRILDPVCGCDGQTYANDCLRIAAGVQKEHHGECEVDNVCGGFIGARCPRGQFCEFGPDECRIADNQGECVDIPDACPAIFDPVCGCDGKTYSNDCDRRAAGVSKVHDGECRDEPRCGGIPGIRCPAGEHCELPEGQCDIADGQGVCVPAPRGCPRILDPVCGCDGQTYANDCLRIAAGVQKEHHGECEVDNVCGGFIGARCPRGQFCEFGPDECRIADNQGECVDIPDACPAIFDPVCGCDGNTYGNDCERRAAQVQLLHEGACEE